MKHLGDITKIDGHKVPIVDIVTGGSPCQDLSVAGKGAGLDGERSGLFMEQIRVIKEMRNECVRQLRLRGANDDIRLIKPRFMVWENVPGAFSSNKGNDFRRVLEEVCRVADKTATVPLPEKGKWSNSGCIMGDSWSVAWRVHDAQFWGVPQRRKRIALVADFGGKSAPEILFEREGVSGNIEQGEQERQEAPGNVRTSPEESAYTLKIRGGREIDSLGHKAGKGALIQTELSGTLGVSQDQTLITIEGNGSRDSHQGAGFKESETMYTLNTVEQHAICVGGGGTEPTVASKASFFLKGRGDGTADTLVATDYKNPQLVCYGLDRASFNQGKNAQYDFSVQEELAQTLVAKGPGGGTDTVGALCARDYKGVGSQYVYEGKLIVQSNRESSQ